jgi:glyceraldehyde-3-phosphate dehydrogenase (NAD(P))
VLNLQADLNQTVSRDEVLTALQRTPRIIVGDSLRSTADIAEYFEDLGRARRDRPEIYVWAEGLHVDGNYVVITFSVHMESITIPDTIDCVRAALCRDRDAWKSAFMTDQALNIAKETACYPPFPV